MMIKQFKMTLISMFLLLFLMNDIEAQQWGHYTLYSLQGSNSAVLLDTNGTTYKTWTFSSAPTGYAFYLTPGGDIWRAVTKTGNSFTGGGITGRLTKNSYSGTLLWDFTYSTTSYCSHHDFYPMQNGNVLIIAYERKSAAEATAAGCSQSIEIWSEKIVEVQPTGATTGTIVWEWHLWDHLVQNYDPTKANYQTSIVNNPQLLNINYQTEKDWVHMNGIDYNPVLDQIAVSSRHLNEIWVIDHSTTTAEAAGHTGGLAGKGGDILYRWGNPLAYQAAGTKIFNVVHDAHWIPEGSPNAGRLVGFNNKGVSINQSSIDQIVPPLNEYNYDIVLGNAYQPSTYTYRLNCNGVSQGQSNSEQLPNGNNLVCMANSGLIYETDPQGTTIWSKQLSGQSVHASRYHDCYINNSAPAIPLISENNSILYSTSAASFQWYRNGVQIPNATGQSYTPTQSGAYLVRISDAQNCFFSYSQTYVFSYTDNVSQSTEQSSFSKIFPNPNNGNFTIETKNNETYSCEICNLQGKIVFSALQSGTVSLENYPEGIYFVRLISENGNAENHKLIIKK